MSVKKSNFRLVMEALKAIAKKGAAGAYFVKRGAIVWEEFPFPKYPRAVSIQVDRRDFMKAENRADCAIEVAALIPGSDEVPEIDDGLMDEFTDLAEFIIGTLKRDLNPDNSDSIGAFAFGVFVGDITEFHDVDFRVQGITAKFSIAY